MIELRCKQISVYQGALTRGKQYLEIARDEGAQQVRIEDDRGRKRWYPMYCFDNGIEPLPMLVDYQLEDQTDTIENSFIEVTVTLSNGERRWCIVATPAALVGCGDWIPETQIRFHYRNRHMLVLEKLSEDLIGRVLRHIDTQGELEECTLPLATNDDS